MGQKRTLMAALPLKADMRRARPAPHIAEARAATLKALQQAEAGWHEAVAKIAERAGLTKGPDGTWRDPSITVAA